MPSPSETTKSLNLNWKLLGTQGSPPKNVQKKHQQTCMENQSQQNLLPPSTTQTTVRESSSNNESIANYVPMIYDQGTFKFHNQEINWIIMEKLEIPDNELEMELFLDAIAEKFIDGYNLQDLLSQDPFDDDQKELIKDIGEELRLRSDWYENLITGMWKLRGKGIRDFHAGNIGIRRSGAEGTLVFFD